ncbi:MAG: DNA polymerase III subunit beta [Actinomycetaceae bacterium]|nr:DNA polymerase III subunit beta [Actinomycetaceae bacterium]
MQLSIDRDVFSEAVSWVARTIQANPAKPILGGILMEATEEGTLLLASHDPEIGARVTVEAQVNEAGSCVVNGRLLSEFSKVIPQRPIELKIEGNKLDLVCGSSHLSMATMPLEDYPKAAQLPELAGSIDGALWQQTIAQVATAASHDDTLPLLVSICIEIDGEDISLMATDRYRLALKELTWQPAQTGISERILIRASRLADISKNLGTVSKVDVYADENSNIIGISAGGRLNTLRRVDGEYPPVRNLFPSESTGYAVVKRKDMVDAIKRVALVVEKNLPVRLSFTAGKVTLEAGQGDNDRISDAIEVGGTNDDISMGFNPNYLREALDSLGSDYARISFTQATKPAVITAQKEAQGEEIEGYKVLQMPIRLYD